MITIFLVTYHKILKFTPNFHIIAPKTKSTIAPVNTYKMFPSKNQGNNCFTIASKMTAQSPKMLFLVYYFWKFSSSQKSGGGGGNDPLLTNDVPVLMYM